MMWQSLIKERKSQIFISVLIIFAIILGLGAALLFHSRSAREISQMQGEAGRAYSLAKSGLDIGKKLGGSSFDNTYNIGAGTLRIQLAGGALTSTGKVGGSTRVLTRTLTTAGTWVKAYGNQGADTLYFVTQAADVGYILGGNIAKGTSKGKDYGFGAGLLDLMLIKTNSSGTKEWANAYGTSGNEISWYKAIRKADITNDGYILVANSSTLGTDTTLLVKVDNNGDKVWARGFTNSGTGVNYGPAVRQVAIDGGYILAVTKNDGNILLIKTDSLGKVGTGATGTTWAKLYDDTATNNPQLWAYDVLEDAAHDRYIVVGYRNHAASRWDAIIFGVDRATGETILFRKRFGRGNVNDEKDIFNSIALDPDENHYIVGGSSQPYLSTHENFWLVKTDINGNVGVLGTWMRLYNHASNPYQPIINVKPIANRYIFGGYTKPPGGYEFLAANVDSTTGDVVNWSKVYGNGDAVSGNEFLHSLDQTSDLGYILGGKTNSYGAGGDDFLVAKVGNTGDLSCSPNISRAAQSFTVDATTSILSADLDTLSLAAVQPTITWADKTAATIQTAAGPDGSATGVITTDVCQ